MDQLSTPDRGVRGTHSSPSGHGSPATSPAPSASAARSDATSMASSPTATAPAGVGEPVKEQEGSRPSTPSRGGDEDNGARSSHSSASYSYDDYSDDYSDEEDVDPSVGSAEVEQESLLAFSSFAMPAELEGHHVMTVRVYKTIMVVGTNQGTVVVLGLRDRKAKQAASSDGAGITSAPQVLRVIQTHSDPISDTSCSSHETSVASCDKAGYVAVQSLLPDEAGKETWRRQMDVPILSIALHPQYEQEDDRPLICAGGDKVFLVSKLLFLSHRRSTVIAEGQGKVRCVRWRGDLVAWVSDQVLCLYNYADRAMLRVLKSPMYTAPAPFPAGLATSAKRPPSLQPQPQQQQPSSSPSGATRQQELLRLELYPPTLLWETRTTLLCGWGDWVQQVKVRALQPSKETAPVASTVTYHVERSSANVLRPSSLENPYRVCGLAPFGTERYLVLACILGDAGVEGSMKDLEVRVVSRRNLEDAYRGRMLLRYMHPLQLGLAFCEGVRPVAEGTASSLTTATDTRAAMYPRPDAAYYIVSMDTVARATPCDEDDHVDYLLRTAHYAEAYHYAIHHELRRHPLKGIAQKLLMAHVAQGDFDTVVRLLPECVSADDHAEWERWVFVLDQHGESWKLVSVLPCRYPPASAAVTTGDGDSRRPGDGKQSHQAAASAELQALSRRHSSLPVQGTVMPAAAFIGKEYYDLVMLRCLDHDAVLFREAVHRFEGLFNVSVAARAAELRYYEATGIVMPAPNVDKKDNSASPSPSADSASICCPAEDDVGATQGTVESTATEETQRKALCEAYGWLLRLLGRNEEALQVLLRVRDGDELFHFVRETQIFQKAWELLPELFIRSEERTIALLLEHAPPVPGSGGRGGPARGNSGSTPLALPQPPLAVSSSTSPLSWRREGGLPGLGGLTSSSGSPTNDQKLRHSTYDPSDPLRPEEVVRRLSRSDRAYLSAYLTALRRANRPAFTTVAKHNAQLVATLLIDYDRPQLLPFLREMSMYLDKMKEIHALCRKYGLLDEVVFLMARMGKEEEGLRVIVQQMKNIRKAVAYVNEAPAVGEQAELFRSLVHLAIETNAQLPVNSADGQRYVLHDTQPGETFASIAESYGVAEQTVVEANTGHGLRAAISGHDGAGGAAGEADVPTPMSQTAADLSPPGTPNSPRSSSAAISAPSSVAKTSRVRLRQYTASSNQSSSTLRRLRRSTSSSHAVDRAGGGAGSVRSPVPVVGELPPPRPCVVPLDLLSELLVAAAAPAVANNPAVDATFLIKSLPVNQPIPNAGSYIAAVSRSRGDEEAFMTTIVQAAERDLAAEYGRLMRRRSAAVRLDPRAAPAAGHATDGEVRDASPSVGRRRLYQAAGLQAGADATTCGFCGQRVPRAPAASTGVRAAHPAVTDGSCDDDGSGAVIFKCRHVYHPRCVLAYLSAEGLLRAEGKDATVASIFGDPARATALNDSGNAIHCRLCGSGGPIDGGVGGAALAVGAGFAGRR